MHPNPAFRGTPAAQNLAFARQRGFGVLAVNGAEGPLAAHVPFLISDDASHADLHLARSNPVGRACLEMPQPALIAISGPDAYISPDWYGAPDQVPTWNYIAVHLRGTLHLLAEDTMQTHVEAISAEHENRLLPKTPWLTDKMSEGSLPRMMRMILPYRFQITGIDGTWKLNQNKTPEMRARTAEALDRRGDAGSTAIAALLRQLG